MVRVMRLNLEGLADPSEWRASGIDLPEYDVVKMVAKTRDNPTWVHFGSGNIFRGFLAALVQDLLDTGKTDSGIITVSTYDYEIIDKIYVPHNNLALLVSMSADGQFKKRVIGSIAQGLVGDAEREPDWERLKQIFRSGSLQMASFTVTEKGYMLTNMSGDLLPDVEHDMANGPSNPRHLISIVVSMMHERFVAGAFPIALVSMDNCSHNGDKLRDSVMRMAEAWRESGFVSSDFIHYLHDPAKVAFPWTMIDKITPRPSESVKKSLEELGFADTEIVTTSKKTFIAPFVNAEVTQYLVIEDSFPNGRMPLEDAGVLFADRDTVDKVEQMKVTTCLNPLHTALAIFGCLLGHTLIADEMRTPYLKRLVERIGYDEGLPVVVDSGVLSPTDFINEVIEKRFPNPYIPDSPQRIATDTSQKVGIRFGRTIRSYAAHSDLRASDLKFIPLVIAGWCRYLMGIGDDGEEMALSPDPMLEELTSRLSSVKLGSTTLCHESLEPILSNESLFGVNLYNVGLGEKIEGYFAEMIQGPGAVARTLEKYVL